ncbi:anthranilate phosphoribosyltransferase [Rosistilla oblonga]|uniref:anthranilate phosphoribosyltransferase n=1 Tax=Rosistilla oblonga TaxID=2527990 RepID=UPI003A972583
MSIQIDEAIRTVQAGNDLAADDVQALIGTMLQGEAEDEAIGELLLALRAKGEVVSELVGAARAMRKHMTPVASAGGILLDTCGTGGDGSGTFNISTAAAIVTAAAGIPVAKHGNRAITSKSGSADVLSALGVNIDTDRDVVERCLAEVGICFCFAPRLHPAMRHVGAIRRQLGVPTLFNLLGPLCNPAAASHQVLGTGKPSTQRQLAEALHQLGTEHAAVVRGLDGLDEVTLDGPTSVIEVTSAGCREIEWTPASFGLSPSGPETMQADGPDESAAIIRQVLGGQPGPARDIVVANAAASIWLCNPEGGLIAAAEQAAAAIDTGQAQRTLEALSAMTSAGQ